MEILIVLAIMGLLVGLAVTKFSGVFGAAQNDVAGIFVNTTMKTPLMVYRLHMGDYPSTADGLNALVTAPQNKADRWRGPYVEKIPLDPWGEPYQYRYPGTKNKDTYDLWSKGYDKADGTADDVGNWTAPDAAAK
jgi:general secretion pathway protein G